jgi:hypothetical protein
MAVVQALAHRSESLMSDGGVLSDRSSQNG